MSEEKTTQPSAQPVAPGATSPGFHGDLFRSLAPEEFARLEKLTPEQIVAAVNEGYRAAHRGRHYRMELPEMGDVLKACAALCPWCGSAVQNEKCKSICRSATCRYRIVEVCCE